MSNKESLIYTFQDFRDDLGGEPLGSEIQGLITAYPSYKVKDWRLKLLEGVKLGHNNDQILEAKLLAKDVTPDSDQSLGGHTRMIDFKIRRAAIRLLYLRHIRDGKTKQQANALVREVFPDMKQNSIAFNTRKR